MAKKMELIQLDELKRMERRNNLLVLAIVVFSLLLFSQTIHFDFTNWDDPEYVVNNEIIRDFSINGIIKIFITPVIGMYNPLTFFVYTFEYYLFGLDPKVFHFFNLLFHLIAIIVLYKFTFRLTNRYETATIVSLLFAIHPMHVSVIGWISQTKTSLMFIFYILALSKYLTYLSDVSKTKGLYLVGIYFILAILSKPDAITLAPILLLLDYYRNRKLDKRLVLEKIPFFIISLFFGIVTILTHLSVEDEIFVVQDKYNFINNIFVSNYAIVFYINKLFIPMNLSAIYPYPDANPFLPLKYYISILVIPGILYLTYKAGNFRKEMIFGLLFFAITISVLVKFIPSGFFRAANRYSYLSYTGLFIIIGQYFVYVIDGKFRYNIKVKNAIIYTMCFFVVFFAYRVTIRVNTWENSLTLFNDVVEKKPTFSLAYKNRGNAKVNLGDLNGALKDFNTAYKLDSLDTEVLNNIGVVNYKMGKVEEGLKYINSAIAKNPKDGLAYNNRGTIKINLMDTLGAIEDWKIASELGVEDATVALKMVDPEFNEIVLSKANTLNTSGIN